MCSGFPVMLDLIRGGLDIADITVTGGWKLRNEEVSTLLASQFVTERSEEMGTKLQYKAYVPGYNFTRDFNEDTNRYWFQCYHDRMQNAHIHDGFLPTRANEYSEYDKEMLKRTMLEHEAIFRKQVYELHRLYKIQKNLMDELLRQKLHRFSSSVDMTQENSFLSNMSTDGTKKMWQMPCFPVVSTNYSRAPVADTDDGRSPINTFKGSSSPSGTIPVQNGGTSKVSGNLDSGLKNSSRKLFDLQLPADQYIESEIQEGSEKAYPAESLFRASTSIELSSIKPENDVHLTLGTGEDSKFRENYWKSETHTEIKLSTLSLADLNEPIKDITGSASTQTFQPRAHREEAQVHLLPVNLQTSFTALRRDVCNDRNRNEGIKSDSLDEDTEKIGQDLAPFKKPVYFTGQISSGANSFGPFFCHEKFPTPSEAVEVKLDHNKRETWLIQKTDHDNGTFGRNPCAPLMPGSFNVSSLVKYANTASQQVSSLTKSRTSVTHVPVAVQALPCFDICERRHSAGDIKSKSRCGSEASSFPKSFGYDHYSALHKHDLLTTFGKQNLDEKCYRGSQSADMKSAKDLNLNETLLNGIQCGLTMQQEVPIGVSWLKNKQASNDSFELKRIAPEMVSGFSRGYCDRLSGFGAVASGSAGKQENQNVHFSTNMQNMSSSLLMKDGKMKNEATDSTRRSNIIWFPLPDQIQNNTLISASASDQEQSFSYEKTSFRGHINLNSAMLCTENQDEPEISLGGKAEVPYLLSKLNGRANIASQIDLEAPIPSQREEVILLEEESIGVRCPLPHTEMPFRNTGSSCVAQCSDESLITEAAESIVAISLDKQTRAGETVCALPSAKTRDCLHWFAETTVNAVCPRDMMAGGSGEVIEDDGLDLFESMTLRLKETNVDEYLCSPIEQDNQKGDNGRRTTSLLLLSKPRRGKGRKRRQRRDFQKDILPGLASLSRNEVTEDLQTIGGLLRDSGMSWQTSVPRRSTGRSKPQSQARGARRPRNLTQPIDTEFKVDGSSVIGWGKTRRCRRQRCPPGNITCPKLKG